MTASETPSADATCGLCARCCHARRIRSRRGSTFYLCQRSSTDSRFPKYPSLPVRKCPGYEAADG